MPKNIIVIGAGAMGAAYTVPLAANGHRITLAGTPADDAVITALKTGTPEHPRLGARLPESVGCKTFEELSPAHFETCDALVLAVASIGIGWAIRNLPDLLPPALPVILVTKGLMIDRDGAIRTYADLLPGALAIGAEPGRAVVGVGGPTIARELALKIPTIASYASHDRSTAEWAVELVRTPFYRPIVEDDPVGLEACAALKNIFAIGVSAMLTAHCSPRKVPWQNPSAAAFDQAVREMALLCEWLGGRRETAYQRPGASDLHVTVGGGRNGRLGMELGKGYTLSEIMAHAMKGETVEGVETARLVAPNLEKALADGTLPADGLPLLRSILDALLHDQPFVFDFSVI